VQVTFYKFNCNKANKEIGKKLDIRVAPTFLIYKGEEEVKRITGAKIPPLQAALDEAIA
jgi:thiol-disulfide isomerase/thioredoxin